MKRIMTIILCALMIAPAGAADAYEDRTASRSAQLDCIGFDFWGNSYKNGRQYLDTREPMGFDQPVQWENTRWDPAVWDEKYGTYWNGGKVLAALFKGRFFERQYMNCNTPYVSIGTPFFDLGEADRLRALALLAEETRVFDNHRSFKIYSPQHNKVIGSFSSAGLHIY